VKNRTLFLWRILTLLCCLHPLSAADRTIVLGREDRWEDFAQRENLALVPGRWGTLDLALRDDGQPVSAQTDLVLRLDCSPVRDEAGRYAVEAEGSLPTDRHFVRGGGSAAFTGERGPLRLLPGRGSLFAPGTWMGDFSIEFWLNPALLGDGEEIRTWSGARGREGKPTTQGMRCTVRGRRLRWSFDDLFIAPSGEPLSVSLEGITPLVPRDWHHHLLRYDSGSGLLEYLVDGIPEAVTYTTDTGRQSGALRLPFAGDAHRGRLDIGSTFTGFIDELVMLRALQEPCTARYGGQAGSAVSRPFDLGYTGTRLKRSDAVLLTPADSGVFLYYRIYDRPGDEQSAQWRQFLPGQRLQDAHGRFLQLMVELYPDGARSSSPELSELRIVYEQDLPPAPPAALTAVAESGAVKLYWSPVNEADVRGYLVYYGDGPGNYHGTDSAQGASPIDVGRSS